MAEQLTPSPKIDDDGHLLSAVGICKHFFANNTRIDVLNNVDFTLDSGETIAVVGESGIGKSTLLHILGTLDVPDAGHLHFRGKEISSLGKTELARFRNESIGFVFQFHYLLPEFSAIENVMMPCLIKAMNRIQSETAAEAILDRVGLSDRLHHRVGKLSGGEQQRVALARALVLSPSMLLADEPTGNLDKKNSEQVHELLLELNREFEMTLVVVTHNLNLAALMSRRVTILDGKLEEMS